MTSTARSSRQLFRFFLGSSHPSLRTAQSSLSSFSACRTIMTSPVTTSLQETLQTALNPTHLEIRNESYKHKGPKDAESHFQVIVVSDQFDSLSLIKRHRLVNQACQSLLDGPIHALSIVAKTPAQWQDMESKDIPGTPNCRGGSRVKKYPTCTARS